MLPLCCPCRPITAMKINQFEPKFQTVHPEKIGGQFFTFLRFLDNLDLNGEYLLNETWYRQSGKGVGKYQGLLRYSKISWTLVHKISWTLVHKRVKTRPEFLPTLTILFCQSPSHTLCAALTWRPTATLNETALDLSEAQIWSTRRC